ncbi:MAG: ankyrin repeat domain-containing protein [Chthoniobacteraceae bacterium]|nr:ankyrin repeat domain-containing protein [Chthoniobacteraceae bacterium]
MPLPSPKRDAETLVAKAPDPYATDARGTTGLMQAAARGDVPALERWVGLGAEVNQMDRLSHTALSYAIIARSAPAVEWLIAHGAAVEGNCCDGACSPLLHALETREFMVIEPILRTERPLLWCRPAREALFTALRMRDKPMIWALLTYHQLPPTLEGSRQPLLGYAIAWGDDELVSLLLECGADPNTALASPVERQFSSCIANARVREDLETEPGMTVLMLAASLGDVECAQLLLDYGAKRGNTTRRYRMTALDFAARRDARPQMLQVLLGKSPRAEDQRMRIHISIARQEAVLYKDGTVAMVAPVSTGMSGFPTPTGDFVVTDKDRLRVSSIYHAEMPYFMRMSCRDFGMHAGVVPGYPASHGCIRLPYDSAVRFFRQVDVGTLVSITR